MLKETTSLVGALEKWVYAIQCEEFHLARTIAKDVLADGKDLIRHAEFDECLRTQFEDDEPEHLLRSLSGLLSCITDAREKAIRKE